MKKKEGKINLNANLDEIRSDTDRLIAGVGALIVKAMRYSTGRKNAWAEVNCLAKQTRFDGQEMIGRSSGCVFTALIKDNLLAIGFKTFAYKISVNLLTGEIAGNDSFHIFYALSISPVFFEPEYWQRFLEEAVKKNKQK